MNIVHTEASLGWGGQEIRILTEAAGMRCRGHQVTLLCSPEAKIFGEAILRGIPVAALPIARKNPACMWALYRWLKSNPVDVINTHSSTDTWLAAIATQFLRNAPPIVRTRHISAPVPHNRMTRWLYQKASSHIVTTGEMLRRQLIEDNGYAALSITSVPTGIDTNYFVPGDKIMAREKLGLTENGIVIGIVATLRSWKGHRYLLEAFAQLPDRNSRLLIVGDGPQSEALQKQIAGLGLADRVAMPGNQRDVLPWLQAMDIFVLPSYANEGVPQALLQAMLCGLAVVTTPIGSIVEAVQPGVTGMLVTPKQVPPLRTAIKQLMDDAELRKKLGRAALNFVQKNFGMQKMLDNMETVFSQACMQR
jgi:glycosyltransferase involved in cell wall biosynthesis